MPTQWAVVPSRPREELFAAASRSVSTNRGTHYPCSSSDIDRARHFHGRHSGQYVSANRADREIVEHNDLRRRPSQSEEAAIRRLVGSIRRCAQHSWGPDLVIKAFLDLDKIFFCGRLRDIVRVCWKQNLNRPGMAGVCVRDSGNPNSGRREIWLNANEILLAHNRTPFSEMWATILHEMCHAYEITQVRPNERERPPHGPHFGTKIRAVDIRMTHLTGIRAIHRNEHYQAYEC